MTHEEAARIDQLISDLGRPIFVLRMASALENTTHEGHRKSARTRARNARIDILNTVKDFVHYEDHLGPPYED